MAGGGVWEDMIQDGDYNLSLSSDQYKHQIDYSQKAPKLERTFRILNFLFVCSNSSSLSLYVMIRQ